MISLRTLHNVTVCGKGPTPILMSHGFGCGQEMFRHLVKAFAPTHQTITYDLAGLGDYPAARFDRRRYRTLWEYADDAIALVEELGLRDVIHVGQSASAMIAGLAAAKRPDLFRSVVMIAPSARYINDGDYHGGFTAEDIEGLIEVMNDNSPTQSRVAKREGLRSRMKEATTDCRCVQDPRSVQHFARLVFKSDHRADLGDIKVPVLVLQCRENFIAPVSVGRYVHDRLPDSRFIMLDARGHCPNLSAPKATITALKRFVDQRESSAQHA